MIFAWCILIVMVLAYGAANFLQGIAATRDVADDKLNPGLLLKLARQKVYLAGVAVQAVGLVTAFVARRSLPLFLVQAAIGAGLAITALLGVVCLRWRLPAAEVGLMALMGLGLTGLIFAAQPSAPKTPNTLTVMCLAGSVLVFAVLANFAARLRGAPGAVALGAVGGLAFNVAAIASRPLVNAHSMSAFLTNPLLYIFLVQTVAGQLIFGLALQRGATTAASAAMNAMAAPAAVMGLVLLGDKIATGWGWLAAIGFVVTLGATVGMAFFASPQQHSRSHTSDEPVAQQPADDQPVATS